jgi:hypothetical protein
MEWHEEANATVAHRTQIIDSFKPIQDQVPHSDMDDFEHLMVITP